MGFVPKLVCLTGIIPSYSIAFVYDLHQVGNVFLCSHSVSMKGARNMAVMPGFLHGKILAC